MTAPPQSLVTQWVSVYAGMYHGVHLCTDTPSGGTPGSILDAAALKAGINNLHHIIHNSKAFLGNPPPLLQKLDNLH